MPRIKKFNEESVVLTLRVPKSLKDILKEDFELYTLFYLKTKKRFNELQKQLIKQHRKIKALKHGSEGIDTDDPNYKKFKEKYDSLGDKH